MLRKIIFIVIALIAISGLSYAQAVKLESLNFAPGFSNSGSGQINGQFAAGVPIAGRVEVSGGMKAELGILYGFDTGVASVEDSQNFMNGITLTQNYPNPSINSTVIEFIDQREIGNDCNIIIQNSLGQEIERFSVSSKPGVNIFNLNTAKYAPGVYQYIIESGNITAGMKMIVVK